MSARPRPKPRPRVASVALPSSPGAAPAISPLEPVIINIDEDEDARFLKNRNRTLQVWKKMDKLAEEQEVKKPKLPFDSGSNDGDDPHATPRHRKYKKVDNASMPSWTKDPKAVLVSSDEDSDDDIIEIVATSSSILTRERILDRSKRKRSRSRSITPPPSLTNQVVQHARETVRRMLRGNVRAESPIFVGEDSLDNIELDPELAKIAMEAKRQNSLQIAHSRSASPEQGGGPETVALKVRWKKHPLNPEVQAGVWAFQMKRHDSFSILFAEVADIAGTLVDNVIIMYEGKRVFSSASPHGIGVWQQAELEACDKPTIEYLQKHRHRSPGPEGGLNFTSQSRGSSPAGTEGDSVAASEAGEDSGNDDETMKIILRAASLKPIALTVRQTTKCSAIMKAFLKHHNLTNKYPSSPVKGGRKGKGQASTPALVVDGDRLNPDDPISAADLEDGDMVEVVGL